MRGTVIGNWIASTFPKELCNLKASDMPKHSHWQRAENPRRICRETECLIQDSPWLASDVLLCPKCGKETDIDSNDGKSVNEGHYLYGLKFYDPNYNVLNAKLEKCDDTFTDKNDVGKTLGELKKAGKVVDLDIYRTWYSQTSHVASKRHTQPTIDGACGVSSVMEILHAIGLDLEQVHDSKKLDIYIIREYKKS
jgi:hypothetical protein